MTTTQKIKESIKVRFSGIDDWNRPVFYSEKLNAFFGSTDILFDYDATIGEVLSKICINDLSYFGREFNCEPMGNKISFELEIV